ncbi:MAG TPA: hypothetical protein VGZ73_13170 [Bryobacteraceae bacterium]|jgi:hypothetical protein|nr:hypothetical protein [Bryobacteraceae bacterium]
MRYSKWLIWFALAAAIALPGASPLAAQDYGRDIYRDRADLRSDYRDLAHDYSRANRLRADIARDQWRLNEALRCGRNWEAQRIARDIDRDRRALGWQRRDIRRDQYDVYRDRRDLRRDYR